MSASKTVPLSIFEAPRELIVPALQAMRMTNSALDALFYDVNVFWRELFLRGTAVVSSDDSIPHVAKAFSKLNLGALSNPEGCVLVVDATAAPYVRRFDNVPDFLEYAQKSKSLTAASVTGVGSSALGSAAFAWNISVTLGQPVAAIVPGYGVADVVHQALGGWFGFGFTTWIKRAAQEALAHAAPETAKIGRGLMMSVRGVETVETGAPVFQRGSGSSDVLHEILLKAPSIERVYGHSKGALVIDNAVRDLPKQRRLQVVTFGCPVAEDDPGAAFFQYLGLFDGLGLLNSWGNRPDAWPLAHHSTNTLIPFGMPVSLLVRIAEVVEATAARRVDPAQLAGPSSDVASTIAAEAEHVFD